MFESGAFFRRLKVVGIVDASMDGVHGVPAMMSEHVRDDHRMARLD